MNVYGIFVYPPQKYFNTPKQITKGLKMDKDTRNIIKFGNISLDVDKRTFDTPEGTMYIDSPSELTTSASRSSHKMGAILAEHQLEKGYNYFHFCKVLASKMKDKPIRFKKNGNETIVDAGDMIIQGNNSGITELSLPSTTMVDTFNCPELSQLQKFNAPNLKFVDNDFCLLHQI